jgi:hypothetical protein
MSMPLASLQQQPHSKSGHLTQVRTAGLAPVPTNNAVCNLDHDGRTGNQSQIAQRTGHGFVAALVSRHLFTHNFMSEVA